MTMRRGRSGGGRRRKQQPKGADPVKADLYIPPGRFRVPFDVMVLKVGSIVGAPAQLVRAHMKEPADLQSLANALMEGRFVCGEASFTAQVAIGIAATSFGIVEDAPLAESGDNQGKESDRDEEDRKEEEEEGGEEAFDGDASDKEGADEEAGEQEAKGPQGLVT